MMGVLADVLNHAVNSTREIKEGSAGDGDEVMVNTVLVHRAEELVAMLILTSGDRESQLQAAHFAAGGMEADRIMLISETLNSSEPVNPVTGSPWLVGEMQDVAEHHGGKEQGWVRDAVLLLVANRAGDVHMAVLPYTLTNRPPDGGEGFAVRWLVDDDIITDEPQGRTPEELRRSMLTDTVSVASHRVGRPAAQFGLTAEQAVHHADCATAQLIMSVVPSAIATLVAEAGSERAAIIETVFGPSEFQVEGE